jgi:hypothetical protein
MMVTSQAAATSRTARRSHPGRIRRTARGGSQFPIPVLTRARRHFDALDCRRGTWPPPAALRMVSESTVADYPFRPYPFLLSRNLGSPLTARHQSSVWSIPGS